MAEPSKSSSSHVVLITGSSSGIGKAAALEFSQKGATVIVTYASNKKNGGEVLRLCEQQGTAALFHLDVRDVTSIQRVVHEVIDRFGRIDVLVNNAGVYKEELLSSQTMEDIREQVSVNLLGLIQMTRAVLPVLLRQKNGVIVNISSGAGKQGFAELTVYCATKFGVRGFTQSLAQELPLGIRTYCVNPGTTATPMTGFRGVDPQKVANVIVRAAEETLGKKSGDDVDVWEFIR